ncbi:unnamed protein product [Miscanthus lutarioriparius]|uniref:Uncharacterized protein n=1 Tax=Miscanthus lutarioriparius TaxID=422564 RepID=A0A811NN45_9POAL|nr:unnamed protein product [Miscanthus lutarioriparius]
MGTLVGHVAPGAGFLLIGLWQLFSHIRLFLLRPGSYAAPLVIGPEKHQPFDDDGTIPPNHLHNFEHASISLALLLFAAVTIHMYRVWAPMREAVSQLVAAAAFAQQLLIFHLHSADHMGVEAQYHWLLQTVIAVTLATTLLGIPYPRSFVGCFLNYEEGHEVVRCRTDEALYRAKSLVNLQLVQLVPHRHSGTRRRALPPVGQALPRGATLRAAGEGKQRWGWCQQRWRVQIGEDEHDGEDDLEAVKRASGHQIGGAKAMEVER